MTLYIIEKERDRGGWLYSAPFWGRALWQGPLVVPELRDASVRDGEWPAVIRLAHETVERDGIAVPLFVGDLDRLAFVPRNFRVPRWVMSRGVSMVPRAFRYPVFFERIDLSEKIDLLWRW